MHTPRVSASLRQGITIDSSSTPGSPIDAVGAAWPVWAAMVVKVTSEAPSCWPNSLHNLDGGRQVRERESTRGQTAGGRGAGPPVRPVHEDFTTAAIAPQRPVPI